MNCSLKNKKQRSLIEYMINNEGFNYLVIENGER